MERNLIIDLLMKVLNNNEQVLELVNTLLERENSCKIGETEDGKLMYEIKKPCGNSCLDEGCFDKHVSIEDILSGNPIHFPESVDEIDICDCGCNSGCNCDCNCECGCSSCERCPDSEDSHDYIRILESDIECQPCHHIKYDEDEDCFIEYDEDYFTEYLDMEDEYEKIYEDENKDEYEENEIKDETYDFESETCFVEVIDDNIINEISDKYKEVIDERWRALQSEFNPIKDIQCDYFEGAIKNQKEI